MKGDMQQNKVILQLGSNLGERLQNLKHAKALIHEEIGTILRNSAIYETEAWGSESKNWFLNEVIVVRTSLDAVQVLTKINQIEHKLGRIRSMEERFIDRTMDIDILFFNDEIINIVNLQIPHPQIPKRKFVLIPLEEIMPEYLHPQLKLSISQLLRNCPDSLIVRKVS